MNIGLIKGGTNMLKIFKGYEKEYLEKNMDKALIETDIQDKINIKDYKNYANFKSNIIIYNIKDVEKLFNYFNNNGIIWGGGRKCTINSIPNGFNPYDKSSYLKLYDDEGRIYYGRNYNLNYSYSETTLTEDDFYIFYEKHKKKINDNFERFLIK